MNPSATIFVSVLFASATALVYGLIPKDGDDALLVGQLEASLGELQEQNRKLGERIDQLIARPVAGPTSAPMVRQEVPAVTPEQVAAAVEAYLRGRDGAVSGAADVAARDRVGFDVNADLEELLGNSYWENTAAWKRAFEAGKIDEVIAALEERAAADPNDIGAQMDLANAYMAHLQMDSSKWQLAGMADKQYDKVLAIDPNHWEARFTKAMNYTFWPDFNGKPAEAITHFEKLIEQQSKMTPEPQHAQTYLFLGNLLSERDPERAAEIGAQGLRRHPGNAELIEKVGR